MEEAWDLLEAKHRKSSAELCEYGNERWESLLQFLALQRFGKGSVSAEMRAVLTDARCIREPEKVTPLLMKILKLGVQGRLSI